MVANLGVELSGLQLSTRFLGMKIFCWGGGGENLDLFFLLSRPGGTPQEISGKGGGSLI